VRLIVEVQAVGNQLLDINLRRTLAAPLTAGTASAITTTAWPPAFASATIPAPIFPATAFASATLISARTASAATILSRWTVFPAATFFRLLFFGFCHFYTFCEGISL
jgi:hypothetical protein